MGKDITGVVIEKNYRPPPGAPAKYWCYLIVEDVMERRVTIRLHQKIHDRFVIGDTVQFSRPWRKNKRVRNIKKAG